jgi:hypothetical protein
MAYLSLPSNVALEPGALANKTRLQHLALDQCNLVPADGAGVAKLLSHIQHMQQLTYLSTMWCMQGGEEGNPPAASYAALTASSKLRHLDVCNCFVPASALQHMFPDGKQLPQLQELITSEVVESTSYYAQAPDSSRLVNCCPGLKVLHVDGKPCSAEQLALLQGLTGLHTLGFTVEGFAADYANEVCRIDRPERAEAVWRCSSAA